MQAARDVRSLQRYFSYRWETRNAAIEIPNTPIFAPRDDEWFRQQLTQTDFYLEFGTGASTLLAAQANVKAVAVESDPHFARALERALPDGHDITIISGHVGLIGGWGYPVFTRKTKKRLAGWRRYTGDAMAALRKLDDFPDFVLIDGRFRAACALACSAEAAAKNKTTTIMFDDYLERPHYHSVENFLGKPEIIERAAIFSISDGNLHAPIQPEDIAAAHQDFR